MNITIPADAGRWFSSVAQQLQRMFVQTEPVAPIKLQVYKDNSLPDATKYRGCIIYVANTVTNTGTVAVSNGTVWSPL